MQRRYGIWLVCGLLLAGCGREVEVPQPDNGAGPVSPAGGNGRTAPALSEGGKVEVGPLAFTAPEGWVPKEPASSFVLAEFQLPRAEGDEADGRLTLSTAGGDVEANIERWRSQFGDQPEDESRDEFEVAGLTVTTVDMSGEYLDQRGPVAPAQKRPGYRMLGAIIPVEGTLYFVKAYGPQKTMDEHAAAFDQFVRSLEVK